MSDAEYAALFAAMTKAELEKTALELAKDCDRLRRELDNAQGVIR